MLVLLVTDERSNTFFGLIKSILSKATMHFRSFLISLFFLTSFIFEVSAQSIKISGQVSSEDGTGLSGVSVLLKGTSIGTVTETDGSFVLTVSKEGTFEISVSSIGYVSQLKEFSVKRSNEIKVSYILKSDSRSMDEAVIHGKTVRADRRSVCYFELFTGGFVRLRSGAD